MFVFAWCEDKQNEFQERFFVWFDCVCQDGFKGQFCEIQISCQLDQCQNGATCEDVPFGFNCTCPDGFVCDLNS